MGSPLLSMLMLSARLHSRPTRTSLTGLWALMVGLSPILLSMSVLLPHARLARLTYPPHHVRSDPLCPTSLLNVCPPHPVWPSAPYSAHLAHLIFILRQGWLTCSDGFHTKLDNKGEERKRKRRKETGIVFQSLHRPSKWATSPPTISHLRKLWFREIKSLARGLIAIT